MNRGQFRRDGHQTRRRPAIDSFAARMPLLPIGSSGVSSFMALHLLCTCSSSTRHAEIELLAVLYCTIRNLYYSVCTPRPLSLPFGVHRWAAIGHSSVIRSHRTRATRRIDLVALSCSVPFSFSSTTSLNHLINDHWTICSLRSFLYI